EDLRMLDCLYDSRIGSVGNFIEAYHVLRIGLSSLIVEHKLGYSQLCGRS
ncbi:unnamed protein product, partial [Allacma fusca]